MILFQKNKNILTVIILLLLITEIYGQGFKFSGISSGKNKGKTKEKEKEKEKAKVSPFNETDPDSFNNLDENNIDEEYGEIINNVDILSNYKADDEEELISKKQKNNNFLVKEPVLNFKTDIGQCICDVTYNKCDVNCCCDPDCSGEKKHYFLGECLPEGPEGKEKPLCSKLLKKVHNPNVIVTDQYSDSGSSVLCIVMDHNPDMGYYYKNPGKIEDKTVFINQFKRLLTTFSYSDRSVSLILPQTNYMLGKPIIVANETQNTYTKKRSDTKRETILQSYAFTLPENTVSGKCEPNSPILFLIDKETECTRKYSKNKKEFTIDYYKRNNIVFVRNPSTNNVTHPTYTEVKMNIPEIIDIGNNDGGNKEYSSDSFNEHKQDYFDPFHPDFDDTSNNHEEFDPFHPHLEDTVGDEGDSFINGQNNNYNDNDDPFNHPNLNNDDNNNNDDPFNHPDFSNDDDNSDNDSLYDPFNNPIIDDNDNNINNNNENDNNFYDPFNNPNLNDDTNNDDNDGIKNDEDFFDPFKQDNNNDDDGTKNDEDFYDPFKQDDNNNNNNNNEDPIFYNPFEDDINDKIGDDNNDDNNKVDEEFFNPIYSNLENNENDNTNTNNNNINNNIINNDNENNIGDNINNNDGDNINNNNTGDSINNNDGDDINNNNTGDSINNNGDDDNINNNNDDNINNNNTGDNINNNNGDNDDDDVSVSYDYNNYNIYNNDINNNIFNEPDKHFDNNDNMIPYLNNQVSDKNSVININVDDPTNMESDENKNAEAKINLGNVVKDNDENEEKVSVINFSPVDKHKSTTNENTSEKDSSKKDGKHSKIHGIKINNKNNVFKRDGKQYIYNNGKYYVKKTDEDDNYKQLLLKNLKNSNNKFKRKVTEKKLKTANNSNNINTSSTSSKIGNTIQKVVMQVNYKIYYTIPAGNHLSTTDIIDFVDVEIIYDERDIEEDELVTQKFSVTFLRSIIKEQEDNPEIDESKVKKIKPRKTSGNPGYIFGKELLTSKLVNGTLEETDVFTIPKNILINDRLRCPMTAKSSGRIPVTFGDDMVSECTLPIDPSINSDYSEISKEILKVHQTTLNNIEYIARFGNTTIDNAWEWIKMIQPESVSTLSSCDTLPIELALQFIWADVGALNNPQPMIIGARAAYGTSGNVCTCTMGSFNENDCDINRKKLSYNIKTTVSFLRLPDHGTELYEPRAPRLIPAVDEDLFYPFFIRNDGQHSAKPISKKWLLIVLSILWIAF